MDLSEVEKLDSPVKTLKLSEAMRIGARLRPQCRGDLFDSVGSCALGAAYEGMTGKTDAFFHSDVSDLFPQILGVNGDLNEIGREVLEKNDGDGWTREQIADWLEAQGY